MTVPGLEMILAGELAALGLPRGETTTGGVSLTGSAGDLWRINLWSRVANRVLVRVDEFHASSFHELERRAKKVEWSRFLSPGQTVRFRVTCRKSKLYHSDAVAERLARAAHEKSGTTAHEKSGTTEDTEGVQGTDNGGTAEEDGGAQLFIVRLADDVCTISADSSGALLHRRGYRQAVAKAPLRETMAAAILIGSGWNLTSPLVDPMCGSGTIAIEGAMLARGIAPGLSREFAFERWPDHDADAWRAMKEEARGIALPHAPGPIVASDRDAGAVAAAIANAERAGVRGDIHIDERAVSDAEYPDEPGWIVTNPPYGLRVGESEPLRNLYARLGRIVIERAKGYRIALLSADRALDAQLGIVLKEVFRTTNGGIPVRLVVGGQGRRNPARSQPQNAS